MKEWWNIPDCLEKKISGLILILPTWILIYIDMDICLIFQTLTRSTDKRNTGNKFCTRYNSSGNVYGTQVTNSFYESAYRNRQEFQFSSFGIQPALIRTDSVPKNCRIAAWKPRITKILLFPRYSRQWKICRDHRCWTLIIFKHYETIFVWWPRNLVIRTHIFSAYLGQYGSILHDVF